MQKRTLLSLLSLSALAILCLFLAKLHRKQPTSASQPDRTQAREVIQDWNSGKFLKIEPTGAFKNFISSRPRAGKSNLTDVANAKLDEILYSFFIAFHNGSYEAYLKYRIPVPAKLNAQKIAMIRAAMAGRTRPGVQGLYHTNLAPVKVGESAPKSDPLIPQASLPEDPVALLKLQFDRSTHGEYKDWWQEVSEEKNCIRVFRLKAQPKSLMDQLTDAANKKLPPIFPITSLGYTSFSDLPTYIFENSPKSILAKGDELLFVQTCWLIKRRPPEFDTPIFATFYWDAANTCWLPYELMSGNNYKTTSLTCIF